MCRNFSAVIVLSLMNYIVAIFLNFNFIIKPWLIVVVYNFWKTFTNRKRNTICLQKTLSASLILDTPEK